MLSLKLMKHKREILPSLWDLAQPIISLGVSILPRTTLTFQGYDLSGLKDLAPLEAEENISKLRELLEQENMELTFPGLTPISMTHFGDLVSISTITRAVSPISFMIFIPLEGHCQLPIQSP